MSAAAEIEPEDPRIESIIGQVIHPPSQVVDSFTRTRDDILIRAETDGINIADMPITMTLPFALIVGDTLADQTRIDAENFRLVRRGSDLPYLSPPFSSIPGITSTQLTTYYDQGGGDVHARDSTRRGNAETRRSELVEAVITAKNLRLFPELARASHLNTLWSCQGYRVASASVLSLIASYAIRIDNLNSVLINHAGRRPQGAIKTWARSGPRAKE